jgi:hypothetical protein
MAMAREGYRIKDPADTPFALFWDLREWTGLALDHGDASRRGLLPLGMCAGKNESYLPLGAEHCRERVIIALGG